jgi:hypothetical protein
MFTFIRKYGAFALSILALMVAIGGTSDAAGQLPKNIIGSKQIKPAAVKSSDLHSDAVSSSTVLNGSLKAEDFAAGVLNKLPHATVQYEVAAAELPENTKASYDVHCLPGQLAVGGGVRGDVTQSEGTVITSSRPIISASNTGAPVDNETFTGWRATVFNPSGGITTGLFPEVWVICLSTS